jgi:hypothetical protein
MAGRILVKPGVTFKEPPVPAGLLILFALRTVAIELGLDLTITSGTDGVHSGPTDPHHLGEAFDVRSHDLVPELRPRVVHAVMELLGDELFYGFLEAAGTSNEHFHCRKLLKFSLAAWLGTPQSASG